MDPVVIHGTDFATKLPANDSKGNPKWTVGTGYIDQWGQKVMHWCGKYSRAAQRYTEARNAVGIGPMDSMKGWVVHIVFTGMVQTNTGDARDYQITLYDLNHAMTQGWINQAQFNELQAAGITASEAPGNNKCAESSPPQQQPQQQQLPMNQPPMGGPQGVHTPVIQPASGVYPQGVHTPPPPGAPMGQPMGQPGAWAAPGNGPGAQPQQPYGAPPAGPGMAGPGMGPGLQVGAQQPGQQGPQGYAQQQPQQPGPGPMPGPSVGGAQAVAQGLGGQVLQQPMQQPQQNQPQDGLILGYRLDALAAYAGMPDGVLASTGQDVNAVRQAIAYARQQNLLPTVGDGQNPPF
jgi:hypothetical protein